MANQSLDVLIIGGGAGGLSCAMTLASAHTKSWFGDRRILVIDDARSDLDKAKLCNAPGVRVGELGSDVLKAMRSQVLQYPVSSIESGRVCSVSKNDDVWMATSEDARKWSARTLVFATGYKRCEIDGLPCTLKPHPRGGKSDRIMLPHDGAYSVSADVHVAGLLAGGSSQFAIAAGIGAQVAVDILSTWAGKRTHVHDVPEPTPC